MPSVLVFGEYGVRNGGENSFLATIPFLNAAGWEVMAAVPSDSEFSRALVDAGATVHPLWLKGLAGNRLSQEQIRFALASLIGEVSPDLVHANSLSMSRLLGPVAQELNIPSLGHIRDIIKCSAKAIADINCLDRIIAVSAATANFHESNGVDKGKLRVVHNGVDLDRFQPPATRHVDEDPVSGIRKELQLSSTSFLAICIGQIGMRKGVESVFEAMQEPIAKHDDVHLLLVGERHSQKAEAIEYEDRLHEISQQFPSGRVHWLGRRDDVDRLLRECNLLVHMPRQEPLGRVLLEAAASGLPMVTTDVGGTREILIGLERMIVPVADNYRNCFDFDSLYADKKLYNELSKQLRTLAVENFADRFAGQNLAKQYNEVLGAVPR